MKKRTTTTTTTGTTTDVQHKKTLLPGQKFRPGTVESLSVTHSPSCVITEGISDLPQQRVSILSFHSAGVQFQRGDSRTISCDYIIYHKIKTPNSDVHATKYSNVKTITTDEATKRYAQVSAGKGKT